MRIAAKTVAILVLLVTGCTSISPMMKRASKFSLLTLLFTMLMTVNAPGVSACSCVAGTPLIYEITNATAIFSAKVAQVTPVEGLPSTSDSPSHVLQASVDVVQVWKGPVSQTLTVSTGSGGGDCGYPFQVDIEYLIFAQEDNGQLYTSICSHTQPLETAGEEIATLDLLFSPSPLERPQPSTTVTVTGHGRYNATADQIEVHLLFREEWQGESPTEEERQQLVDLLMAHGATTEMLFSGPFYGNETGFYFIVNQEYLPNADLNTFLRLLSEVETALQQESELSINGVEVRFSLQDCTQAAAGARTVALTDARTRAELLAALAGGKRGAIMAIVETSSNLSPEATLGLCYAVHDEWHPVPLQSDLGTLQQIAWRATLTVTFAVEEARAVQVRAIPTSLVTAPSSTQISPIPTPTGQ